MGRNRGRRPGARQPKEAGRHQCRRRRRRRHAPARGMGRDGKGGAGVGGEMRTSVVDRTGRREERREGRKEGEGGRRQTGGMGGRGGGGERDRRGPHGTAKAAAGWAGERAGEREGGRMVSGAAAVSSGGGVSVAAAPRRRQVTGERGAPPRQPRARERAGAHCGCTFMRMNHEPSEELEIVGTVSMTTISDASGRYSLAVAFGCITFSLTRELQERRVRGRDCIHCTSLRSRLHRLLVLIVGLDVKRACQSQWSGPDRATYRVASRLCSRAYSVPGQYARFAEYPSASQFLDAQWGDCGPLDAPMFSCHSQARACRPQQLRQPRLAIQP